MHFTEICMLFYSIGFGIARRLAREGAKVVISSRKQKNVDDATSKLKSEGLDVSGIVCHVGKKEDRQKLYDEVEYSKQFLH